ncbi:MAG: hypothetical protein A2521_05785 [Deltaproteobacteria bacterium RIFOXYD12_FULL_57_12]|nr:MAG: hypothetical protein A2521_05785 [Deltaproteobacteria bacterium RIFOXYD12_FULL_57_12]
MQAMILAAGFGTRLRPFSLIRPKPLFPILGRPLLSITIASLRRTGCATIVVNAHHLREQIRAAVKTEAGIILQVEEEILGTGGGLRRALPHFTPEPLLVVNGDILHDLDLAAIYRRHLASGCDATLVLHDCPRFNTVLVAERGLIHGFSKQAAPPPGLELLAFTGIHVLNPEILRPIPGSGFYNIIDRYQELLARGGRLRAEVVRDHFWTDMGTVPDYLELHAGLLQGRVAAGPELAAAAADRPFQHAPDVVFGENVRLEEWVSIGAGVRIGDNATLGRVVVWDNAVIPAGAVLHDTIMV